jgi:sec-independent protein translocase protein TatA
MFGAIGVPELIVILVIALLIFGPRRLPALGRSLGQGIGQFRTTSSMAINPTIADSYGAIPDWRYAHGVQAGAIAELFGLGINRIRRRQVVVVVIGTWLSGNASRLQNVGIENLSVQNVVVMTVWPIIFVFCAITAIRSFQSGVAVAVSTGPLHSLLFTSVRFVTFGSDVSFQGMGLIRFRGHFPKEGYDVHDVHDTGQAGAPAL